MFKKIADQYLKIVEWSNEDACYVGTAPGLLLGGVHGKNQKKVFTDLCVCVEEAIKLYKKEGKPLPEATINKNYSGKILLRLPPTLHKTLSIQALKNGESLNNYLIHQIEEAAFL